MSLLIALQAHAIPGAGQIATAQAVGAPAVRAGLSVVSIASAQAVGVPAVHAGLSVVSIASAHALGAPALRLVVATAGAASAAAVGQPSIATGASIVAAGIPSAAQVGQPVVQLVVQPDVAGGGIRNFQRVPRPRYAVAPPHSVTGAGAIHSLAVVGHPAVQPGRLTHAARRRKDEQELFLLAA